MCSANARKANDRGGGTSDQAQGPTPIVFGRRRRTAAQTQVGRGKDPSPGTSDLAQFLLTAVHPHSQANLKKKKNIIKTRKEVLSV